MTIEESDIDCPECGTKLQAIYVTELAQTVSGWACPNCGYVASRRDGYEDQVAVAEETEYLMRVERPLSSGDVRPTLDDVEDEFRARASEPSPEELWLLIDPETGEIVDLVAGAEVFDDESES
jgi:DNA-directed RNA polymerase subunit RPC12/RpoP